jgi:hypothetical protein
MCVLTRPVCLHWERVRRPVSRSRSYNQRLAIGQAPEPINTRSPTVARAAWPYWPRGIGLDIGLDRLVVVTPVGVLGRWQAQPMPCEMYRRSRHI